MPAAAASPVSHLVDRGAAFWQAVLDHGRALRPHLGAAFLVGLSAGLSAALLEDALQLWADPVPALVLAPEPAVRQLLGGVVAAALQAIPFLAVLRAATPAAQAAALPLHRLIWGSLRIHGRKWRPLWWGLVVVTGLSLALASELARFPGPPASPPPSLWALGALVLLGLPLMVSWSLWRCIGDAHADGDLLHAGRLQPMAPTRPSVERLWQWSLLVGATLALDAALALVLPPAWRLAIGGHLAAGLWALASLAWSAQGAREGAAAA